jgi:membrane-associated phospholipid phosphatase
MLNVAMADAAISCWEAKYHYVFWRPVTAIPLAADDGNAATDPDAGWLPLLVTPAFPEYPSGHSSVSGAAGAVLSAFFGERTDFTAVSDTLPNVTRSFHSFRSATLEVNDARVFGGIHFRTAVVDGRAAGTAVARYVMSHAFQPRDDDEEEGRSRH